MLEALIQFGIHVLLAALGLLAYSLWSVRDKFKVFDEHIFIHENKGFWKWAITLQLIFAIVIALVPGSEGAIKLFFGLDYSEPMAFFMTGGGLANAANIITKDKIGKKTEKTREEDA